MTKLKLTHKFWTIKDDESNSVFIAKASIIEDNVETPCFICVWYFDGKITDIKVHLEVDKDIEVAYISGGSTIYKKLQHRSKSMVLSALHTYKSSIEVLAQPIGSYVGYTLIKTIDII